MAIRGNPWQMVAICGKSQQNSAELGNNLKPIKKNPNLAISKNQKV